MKHKLQFTQFQTKHQSDPLRYNQLVSITLSDDVFPVWRVTLLSTLDSLGFPSQRDTRSYQLQRYQLTAG